jgi:hypothetical protein
MTLRLRWNGTEGSNRTHNLHLNISLKQPNRLMLFAETVTVYCENHMEHTYTVRTSQETHYVSTTETNRLMLFGETFAVYCENHTEQTDTIRTSPETHHGSATEPNRLILFSETTVVFCENRTELVRAECKIFIICQS